VAPLRKAAPDTAHDHVNTASATTSCYDFLATRYLTLDDIDYAEAIARDAGLFPHDVLISGGRITETDYTDALGSALGLVVIHWGFALRDQPPDGVFQAPAIPADLGSWAMTERGAVFLISATAAPPDALAHAIGQPALRTLPLALAPHSSIQAQRELSGRRDRLKQATDGLKRITPELSAALPVSRGQKATFIGVAAALVGGLTFDGATALTVVSALLGLPFMLVAAMRYLTLRQLMRRKRPHRRHSSRRRLPDHVLPFYSVLVPLFKESEILPDLVAALTRLNYPPGKLEILLVLEAADLETHASLMMFELPGHFRIIIVPDSLPRTKPKALNYALALSRGDFVVVYDAEDRPEPAQLRDALEVFRNSKPNTACVQAQLNIYNPLQSWFTRQFTIEYSALFDAILPALAAHRLPVPLGGTSNHFPRAVLEQLGGWDPYNVTEDADLGIRLARLGWETAIVHSTTWEEAPARLDVWIPQRTRWLKGWMQTYLVHTRAPFRLGRDLGLWRALGLHVYVSGLILSSLAHPWMYVMLAAYWFGGNALIPPDDVRAALIWWTAWISLLLGYVSSILIAVICVRRRHSHLVWDVLWTPVYWLLISYAAYRALWQLWRAPYLWEKTPHGKTS
jgi:glycosyltransferase XagB